MSDGMNKTNAAADVDVEDPSTDIETLRCAIDRLTQRLAMAETENMWLRRENESLKAWNATAFPRHRIATGHL